MKLSIIVVNWNTCEYLRDCLASVYANPPSCDFEVWVVDNNSRDDSRHMVKDRFPQVNLISNGQNVGFARANNQAIRQSNGQYVLLLNSDTKVKPGALDALMTFADENPQAGAVGAQILNADGTLQISCYPAPTLSRELWYLLHLDYLRAYGEYRMETWNPCEPRPVDILLGACLLLRRAALDEVGLLDEDFFMYSEEVDLCYRLKGKGWQIFWAPQAKIIHYGGQSTTQVAAKMFVQLYRSKVMFFRKHYGPAAVLLYKSILAIISLPRILSTLFIWAMPAGHRQQLRVVGANYRRLIVELPYL